MKLLLPPVLAFALSACTGSGGIEQVHASKDASGIALGNVPADQVAQCIGSAFGDAPQTAGTAYVLALTGPGNNAATLRIEPFNDPLKRFVTKVEVVGQIGSEREQRAVLCVQGGAQVRGRPIAG